jgi:signal transduction histidine kinase
VTADHLMSEVVISVLDDGIGMPLELMAAPFEAARRPSKGTGTGNGSNGKETGNGTGNSNGTGNEKGTGNGYRRSAGAGLGLSIAKGIVQAHGGRIELAPQARGTCFRVYLPVEAEVDAARLAGSLAGAGVNDATGSDGTAGDGPAASGRDRDGDDD